MHPRTRITDSTIIGLIVGSYIGAGLSQMLPIQILPGLVVGMLVGIIIAVLLGFAAIGKNKPPNGWQIGAWVGGITSIVGGIVALVGANNPPDIVITILSTTVAGIVIGGLGGMLVAALYGFIVGLFRKSSSDP